MHIKENIDHILSEIEDIKVKHNINRDITLCAATKYVDAPIMNQLVINGVNHLGENRVEAFLEKYDQLKNENIVWHFIGSLQSRKVKKIINNIDYLHSLDRLSLAEEINKHRLQPLNCFVEVNCSQEETKHGIKPSEVISFIHSLENYDKIRVIGLMTMAENTTDENIIRQTFKQLKDLQKEIINLKIDYAPCLHLSMGMSNDYPIAIEEGATFIRIGSKLFK